MRVLVREDGEDGDDGDGAWECSGRPAGCKYLLKLPIELNR